MSSIPCPKPPTITPPLETPHPISSPLFTISTALPIAAPPLTLLKAILTLPDYPLWNPFIPAATIVPPRAPVISTTDTTVPPEVTEFLNAIPSAPTVGTLMDFQVHFSSPFYPNTTTRLLVTSISTLDDDANDDNDDNQKGRGYRVTWRPVGNEWFLTTERVHEIREVDGGCEYRTWETFGGVGAYAVRYTVGGGLIEGFEGWGAGLKKYVEGK